MYRAPLPKLSEHRHRCAHSICCGGRDALDADLGTSPGSASRPWASVLACPPGLADLSPCCPEEERRRAPASTRAGAGETRLLLPRVSVPSAKEVRRLPLTDLGERSPLQSARGLWHLGGLDFRQTTPPPPILQGRRGFSHRAIYLLICKREEVKKCSRAKSITIFHR